VVPSGQNGAATLALVWWHDTSAVPTGSTTIFADHEMILAEIIQATTECPLVSTGATFLRAFGDSEFISSYCK